MIPVTGEGLAAALSSIEFLVPDRRNFFRSSETEGRFTASFPSPTASESALDSAATAAALHRLFWSSSAFPLVSVVGSRSEPKARFPVSVVQTLVATSFGMVSPAWSWGPIGCEGGMVSETGSFILFTPPRPTQFRSAGVDSFLRKVGRRKLDGGGWAVQGCVNKGCELRKNDGTRGEEDEDEAAKPTEKKHSFVRNYSANTN